VVLPELRAALDVGKEESNGAGGQRHDRSTARCAGARAMEVLRGPAPACAMGLARSEWDAVRVRAGTPAAYPGGRAVSAS
jgi:hypothetical protein